MKQILKAAMLIAAVVLASASGAQAAHVVNVLILGFDRVAPAPPQPADYVINLGNYQTAVGVGGTSVANLTSLFEVSTFNSLYGSLSSGVSKRRFRVSFGMKSSF
ncbi:MAG TPA: hypothetical protein VFA77_13805, partial [Candidatus Eisenbacteria bacterium]|nr:hypothetical protein [Candidatus Eisenbacteria bacterium]